MIPKVIHKVYIEDSMELPEKKSKIIEEAHASWKRLNPEYVIKYYSGKDCESYLRDNYDEIHVKTFKKINAYCGKCDFFRYCVINKEGGIYSDWKQECLKPIESYINQEATFFAFNDKGNIYSVTNNLVHSGYFGGIKNHKILLKAIELSIKNVSREYYGNNPLDILSSTLFTEAIKEGKDENTEIIGDLKEGEDGLLYYKDHNNKREVVIHKAKDSGYSQDWERGNNYNELWNKKMFYNRNITI